VAAYVNGSTLAALAYGKRRIMLAKSGAWRNGIIGGINVIMVA